MSKQSNQRYRKELDKKNTTNKSGYETSDSYIDQHENYNYDEFESNHSNNSYDDEDS